MPMDLLPELALQGAEAVRRALEGREPGELGAAFHDLLRQAGLAVDFLHHHRTALDKVLRTSAMQPERLRDACGESLKVADELLALFPLLRNEAQRRGDDVERSEAYREISRWEQLTREAIGAFTEWLAAVNRAPPPIDQERFQRGVGEAGRGEAIPYASLDEMVGDLAGEA
jgi:hypothetical protein